MLIKKNIEVGIDVQDPINVFTDPENIKYILEKRYEGKCYRGCYIKSINRILRIGECVINQDGDPKFGTIPVIMEVSAIVYAVGEIINGCTVQNKDHKTGIIICSTDIASIILMADKSLSSITKNQMISIRVANVRYNQGSVKISISAVPYLFSNKPIVYKIGSITEKDRLLLTNVLERIQFEEGEMTRLKEENLRAWETFDQLLYAYKEEQKTPVGARILNIVDIATSGVDNKVVYLSRDSRINLSTPKVYGYTEEKFPDGAVKKYEIPTGSVLLLLLEDYCAHLRTIREMIGIYSTEDLIVSHRNVWQIFKKGKF